MVNGFQWIINGKVNLSFFLLPADTNFPRTVSERNNVTITVIRASPVANSPGRINLISSLTVDRLNPILYSNVYCQFFNQQSSTFFVIATGNSAIISFNVTSLIRKVLMFHIYSVEDSLFSTSSSCYAVL